jgi:hypothetical protein
MGGRRGLIWLKHKLYRADIPSQNPFRPIYFYWFTKSSHDKPYKSQISAQSIKIKGRREKQVFSGGGYQWEMGGLKERGNEGGYGEWILYPYMKTEKWNQLNLFYEEGWGVMRENNAEGKSN